MTDNKNKTQVVRPKSPVKGNPSAQPSPGKVRDVGNSGHTAVVARNEFYKEGASILKYASIGACACLVAAIATTFYSASQKENNVYFAAKPDKSIIQLVALSEPNLSSAAVTNWLSRALIDTFDFNFSNVKQRLNDSTMRWFTPDGGDQLLKALSSAGNIDSVIATELFVGLTLDGAPLLIDEAKDKDNNNVYAWKYQAPGVITYRTRSKTFTDKVVFTITVQRQSMISSPDGLGIAKIIMLVKR
jgi:intracellular multiplication protein IcmL